MLLFFSLMSAYDKNAYAHKVFAWLKLEANLKE